MRRKNESFEIVETKKDETIPEEYYITSSVISDKSFNFSENIGFWNNLYKNISDIKNIIKFNFIATGKKVNFEELKHVSIYNRNYNLNHEYDELLCDLNGIFWFSYKSNFAPIVYNNKLYTSDAGWGCMIRCGQMIMAKAIYSILDRRLYDNCLLLFSDNQLKYKAILNKSLFSYFSNNDTSIIKQLNVKCSLVEFEYINDERKLDYIIAPFSIRNICNISHNYNKGAGDWFSNYDMIKILEELNDKYDPVYGMKILNFSEGILYIEDIINNCFRRKYCNCSSTRISYTFDMMIEYTSNKIDDDFVVIDRYTPKNECKCFADTFIYMNNHYEMVNKFVIFISVMLGLDSMDESYHNSLLSFFNLYNNLGIIGGKGSKALYFIGKYENNLLFLDPHFVQENEKSSKYTPENIFFLDIKDMTPCFTMGFYCRDISDFRKILLDIQEFQTENTIIILKNKRKFIN